MYRGMSRAVMFSMVVGTLYGSSLQEACLDCHRQQKIPSSMVYKRYLVKYSAPQRIEDAMVSYLKHPSKEASIMPSQFFVKFPMKKALKMDEPALRQWVKAYMKRYDLKKRLYLAPVLADDK